MIWFLGSWFLLSFGFYKKYEDCFLLSALVGLLASIGFWTLLGLLAKIYLTFGWY